MNRGWFLEVDLFKMHFRYQCSTWWIPFFTRFHASFQIDINGIIKLPKSINDEENEEKRVFDLYICAFYKRVNGWNDIIFPNPLFVKKEKFSGVFHVILPFFTDAEKFCRKNVDTMLENLEQHLVTAYTIQEKQAARELIREKFGGDTFVKHQLYQP